MTPSPESLRSFLAAMQQPSFTAAARVVGLTPAAFGQRIRQLEEQLDARLFDRTTRRVAPTDAGRRLVGYAERILALGAEAGRAIRGELGAAPFELTIGTRHELGLSWLQPLLPSLERAIPALTTHLYVGSGNDLLVRLRTSEIDVAVGSMRVADPRLDAILLHREDYAFVATPALLRRQPLRRAEHASAHVLVDTQPELPLFDYLRASPGPSLSFKKVLVRGTIAAIRAAVLAHEGVAVLPRYLVADDLRRRRLVRVLPSRTLLSDHFRLVFRMNDARRPVFGDLATELLRHPLR